MSCYGKHRIQLARQMASGLGIVVKSGVIEDQVVNIKVTEYPTFISPVNLRRKGGGYEAFDPDSSRSQEELRRQAGDTLQDGYHRYRGCAENIGKLKTYRRHVRGCCAN